LPVFFVDDLPVETAERLREAGVGGLARQSQLAVRRDAQIACDGRDLGVELLLDAALDMTAEQRDQADTRHRHGRQRADQREQQQSQTNRFLALHDPATIE